jgi:carbohydrate kinase (thermoresistant glucokinase family)
MVLILIGPVGCSKTTIGKMLAEKLGWSFYDGDDFHPQENVEKMRAGAPLSDEDRKAWLENLHVNIQRRLTEGRKAILGLHPSTSRARMHKLGILRPETRGSD